MYYTRFFASLLLFLLITKLSIASNLVSFISPKDRTVYENPSIILSWNKALTQTSTYKVQVSDDSLFQTTLISITTSQNSYTFIAPVSNKIYYWRVKLTAEYAWGNFYRFIIFKPSDFSSIKNHYRSDVGVTTSGTSVTQWNDVTPNANHAKQSDPGSQPTLKLNIPLLNNLPTLRFAENASSPDYLSLTTQNNLTSFSIFTVNNYVYNPNKPLEYSLGGNVAGILVDASAYNDSTEYGTISLTACGCFGFCATVKKLPGNIDSRNTNYAIYTYKNASLRRNKKPPFLYTNSSRRMPSMSIDLIGTRPDALSFNFEGDMAEVLFYDTELDSVSTSLVEDYLHTKYAPPVNLGPDTVFGTSFCDTLRLETGNRFVSYKWSTGATTSSIKATANNIYSVTTKDVFGFESYDEIVVMPYKRLGNKTIIVCKGDTFKIDLNLPLTYTINWSNGVVGSKINLNRAGQYISTILGPNVNGCSTTIKDTINIIIDSIFLNPIPSIQHKLNMCQGEKLFILSPQPLDSILWSTGSTDNFINVLPNGPYTLKTTSSNGCKFKDSVFVTITGQAPTANFISSAVCQNSATNFTDLSLTPTGNTITSWKWNFSNGTSSTTQNPTNTYNSLGTSWATLKVKTNVGCSDSIYKSFTTQKKPIADFDTRLSCSGNPTQLVDNSRIGSALIGSYNWLFANNPTPQFIQNPQYYFPDQGSYPVFLKITDTNGCLDTITKYVYVNPSPDANFAFDSACGKTAVNFKYLATVQSPFNLNNTPFEWDFGDGTKERAIYDAQHSYSSPGTYTVKLYVQASNYCVDTVEKQIKIFDFPTVDFTVSPTQCVNKEIQFTDISATPDGTPINDWKWYFSGQTTSTNQNPRYSFASEGNYTIQLTAKNTVGCAGTKLRNIAVSKAPIPKFAFTPQNGLPPLNVTYINQSATTGNYVWNYGDGSPSISGYNPPTHIYNAVGSYPITLVSTDFRGCTDTARKYILVDRAFLDGAMVSIVIIPNGEYYKIQANIVNNSNIEITALGLSLQLGGGSLIRENWNGVLKPGESTIYEFFGEIKLSDNNQIPVICASIDNVNNFSPESRTDNNSTCKEVRIGQFDVLNLYPNPAEETLNFGVMLPKDGKVTIGFITILGQLEYKFEFDGLKGYNNFPTNTFPLNAAVYVAEITFDGQVIRKKFMRKDRK